MICLEEPENGIHPARIARIVELLRDIAVDSMHPVEEDNPLRQIVINTHSPEVFQNVDPATELVFLEEEHVVRNGARGRSAGIRCPQGSWRGKIETYPQSLAPGRIRDYLGGAAPQQQRQQWFSFCPAEQ